MCLGFTDERLQHHSLRYRKQHKSVSISKDPCALGMLSRKDSLKSMSVSPRSNSSSTPCTFTVPPMYSISPRNLKDIPTTAERSVETQSSGKPFPPSVLSATGLYNTPAPLSIQTAMLSGYEDAVRLFLDEAFSLQQSIVNIAKQKERRDSVTSSSSNEQVHPNTLLTQPTASALEVDDSGVHKENDTSTIPPHDDKFRRLVGSLSLEDVGSALSGLLEMIESLRKKVSIALMIQSLSSPGMPSKRRTSIPSRKVSIALSPGDRSMYPLAESRKSSILLTPSADGLARMRCGAMEALSAKDSISGAEELCPASPPELFATVARRDSQGPGDPFSEFVAFGFSAGDRALVTALPISTDLGDNDDEGNMSCTSQLIRDTVQMTMSVRKSKDDFGTKMLNHYVILQNIGQGAFGKVKLAFDSEKETLVAIKSVRRSKSLQALAMQAREMAKNRRSISKHRMSRRMSETKMMAFQREIAVMKKLRHKNIVSLFEVIDDAMSEKLYFVMQYVDNGPLATIIEGDDDANGHGTTICSPTYSPGVLAAYARQICSGLEYLHQRSIAHRDIKPDNILKNSNDQVFLADFGISEMTEEKDGDDDEECEDCDEEEGSVNYSACSSPRPFSLNNNQRADDQGENNNNLGRGTLPFMAPELFCSPETAEELSRMQLAMAADVWALGVTFYCLLCGKLPFSTKAEILSKDVVHRKLSEIASPSWRTLITAMLTADPSLRPKIAEIRRTVKGFCNSGAADCTAMAADWIEVKEDEISMAVTPMMRHVSYGHLELGSRRPSMLRGETHSPLHRRITLEAPPPESDDNHDPKYSAHVLSNVPSPPKRGGQLTAERRSSDDAAPGGGALRFRKESLLGTGGRKRSVDVTTAPGGEEVVS